MASQNYSSWNRNLDGTAAALNIATRNLSVFVNLELNMPGPKMGPRPPDFDEELVRKAPTFQKWLQLLPGETLTYACRQFVKGGVEDEERLMRRIMIARRNNLKDHAVLKRARAAEAEKRGAIPITGTGIDGSKPGATLESMEESSPVGMTESPIRPLSPSNPSGTKRRRVAGSFQPTDEEILREMDVPAVEATRSYRKWLALPEGGEFTYNHCYVKGAPGHDWLLKKSIWRRMRYRRENQNKVEMMKSEVGECNWPEYKTRMMSHYPPKKTEVGTKLTEVEEESVSRAVAAAAASVEVGTFEPGIDADAVAALGADDPIVSSALDAAAQLAASAVGVEAPSSPVGLGGHIQDSDVEIIV
ncbi:hypothetical protein ACHAWF_005679 [Thalassiosira exigua]